MDRLTEAASDAFSVMAKTGPGIKGAKVLVAMAFAACLAMSCLSAAPSRAQGENRDFMEARGSLVLESVTDLGNGRVKVAWKLYNATAAVQKLCVHWRIGSSGPWSHECRTGNHHSGDVEFDTDIDDTPLVWSPLVSVYLNLHYVHGYPSSFSRTVTILVSG